MANPADENFSDSPIAPAQNCFAIVPDDIQQLAHVTKALYVGGGGNLTCRALRSNADVTFTNVPSGYILDVRMVAVRATGTTAVGLVGLA